MTASVQAISAQDMISHASQAAPDTHAMSQRFDKLMAHEPHADSFSNPYAHDVHATPVSKTLHALDEADRMVMANMERFRADLPTMDMRTLTARTTEMNLQIATQSAQFTACTSVAQSTKNGIQTLLKNQ